MFVEVTCLFLALLLFKWLSMDPFYWRKKGVPADIPLPIFGSSLVQFFDTFHGYWNGKYKSVGKCGPMYGFHNFSKLTLMIADPEVLSELVAKSDSFTSRGIHTNPHYDITAKGVFFQSGEEWKRIRNKLTPFFSPSRLKSVTRMMAVDMKEFADRLDDAEVADVNELSLKLSTAVVVNTVFGIKPDSFTNPDSFFFRIQEEIFGHVFLLKILLGTIAPYIYDLFRVTVISARTTSKLKGFVEDVFAQRARNIGVRQDFIQGMIELVKTDSQLPSHNITQCKVLLIYFLFSRINCL